MAAERKGQGRPQGKGRTRRPEKARGTGQPVHKPEKKKRQGILAPYIRKHPVRWAIIGYATFVLIVFAAPIFSPNLMVFGTDTMAAGPFFRSLHADSWSEHFRMPLWNPYIHAGLPFVDAMHGDIFYPAAILQIIFPVTYALGFKLILHVFLAGVFMFLFLRGIGRSDTASFVGGILYMFSPCLVSLIYPGHDGKMYVTALAPLAFLVLHRAIISRRLVTFLAFGLTYALLILTAHVQMAFYASWGLGLYFLFMLWDRYRFRLRIILPLGLAFALAVILGLGASAMQWMAPYKYLAKYSQRLAHQERDPETAFAWSSSWSMNSEDLVAQINPAFPGVVISYPDRANPKSQRTYWGQNFFKLNSEAVGVLALALALVALLAVRGPVMWFFAGLSVISLLYGMGASTPVFRLFYDYVPMVKKFRAPSMIIFLVSFSWITMAAYGIDALRAPAPTGPKKSRRKTRDPLKVLAIIAGVYTVIAVLAMMAGESLMTGWASLVGSPLDAGKLAAVQANASHVREGFLMWTVVLWALVAAVYMRRRGLIAATVLTLVFAHLAGLPLLQFNKRFVETVDPRPYFAERPILKLIRDNAPDEPYRVLNLRGTGVPNELEDNYLALHRIEELSPTAMHGNHLLTFDIFVGRHDSSPALMTNKATRDLMNSYFILSPTPVREAGLVHLGRVDGLSLYRNEGSLPRAAVFYQYEVEADTTAILARIRSDGFPYRSRIILDQELPNMAPVTADAAPIDFTPARVVDWEVDRFAVEYTAERDGLLWLSENYYPAWVATDASGETLPIYRADYTFRAVAVKAGTNRITFEFHNAVFANSLWLSLVCLLILFGGAGLALRTGRREPSL